MKNLRKKLKSTRQGLAIETIRGFGNLIGKEGK